MRRLLLLPLALALGCVPALVAEDAGHMISDAGSLLEDAGAWLSDAGADMSDAGSAQGQETISVPCEVVATRTIDYGSGPTTTRYWGAFLPGSEGSTERDLFGVEAVACGRLQQETCPDGATCSGSALHLDCLKGAVGLSVLNGRIVAGCGTDLLPDSGYSSRFETVLFRR